MRISRTQQEIDDAMEEAGRKNNRWPGQSYEEGFRDAIDWILGDTDENPMEA